MSIYSPRNSYVIAMVNHIIVLVEYTIATVNHIIVLVAYTYRPSGFYSRPRGLYFPPATDYGPSDGFYYIYATLSSSPAHPATYTYNNIPASRRAPDHGRHHNEQATLLTNVSASLLTPKRQETPPTRPGR